MYNNKGNPAHIKARLDAEKAHDLRTNHFTIGGGTANVCRSMQQLGFRPQSAKEMKDARP